MRIEILVDAGTFWKRLRADLRAARRTILAQTFSLEADAVGQALVDEIVASDAPDKRLLVDSFVRLYTNDRLLLNPCSFLRPRLRAEYFATQRLIRDLRGRGVQARLTWRDHKKMVVIDGTVAYFGGVNFTEHNFSWHDMMLRVEDPDVAGYLAEAHRASWSGKPGTRRRQFTGLELLQCDGTFAGNRAVFGKVLDAIDGARSSIFVQSPNLSYPFFEPLRRARRRGVSVRYLTHRKNGYLMEYAKQECGRSDIDLWFLRDRTTHLKAMLIDEDTLVAGSSNFNLLSYRVGKEILAVLTEPAAVAAFRERVRDFDLADSSRCHVDRSPAPRQVLHSSFVGIARHLVALIGGV